MARRALPLRRSAAVTALLALLGALPAAPASPGPPRGHASTASTSRWWKLDCDQGRPGAATTPPACLLRVRMQGRIDRSRLHLIEQALRRRDATARALGRDVSLEVDVDSRGGEVFAAMEIGRLLRRGRASLAIGEGAWCVSACVFALMGAVEARVADGARIGIHRPSLGEPDRDALVESMTGPLALYADEMRVSRALIADMLEVPAGRIRLLRAPDFAGYGIAVSTPAR